MRQGLSGGRGAKVARVSVRLPVRFAVAIRQLSERLDLTESEVVRLAVAKLELVVAGRDQVIGHTRTPHHNGNGALAEDRDDRDDRIDRDDG